MSTFNFPLKSFSVHDGCTVRCGLDLGFSLTMDATFYLLGCCAPPTQSGPSFKQYPISLQAGAMAKRGISEWFIYAWPNIIVEAKHWAFQQVSGDMHSGSLPSLREYMLAHGFAADVIGRLRVWNSAECQKLVDDYPEERALPEPK